MMKRHRKLDFTFSHIRDMCMHIGIAHDRFCILPIGFLPLSGLVVSTL